MDRRLSSFFFTYLFNRTFFLGSASLLEIVGYVTQRCKNRLVTYGEYFGSCGGGTMVGSGGKVVGLT